MGVISEMAPTGQALARAIEIAREIAALPPIAVMQIKEIVNAGLNAPLDTALMLERKALPVAVRHPRPEGRHAGVPREAQTEVRREVSVAQDLQRPDLIVAVIGAGTMGRGIAQVCAQAGMTALLFDSRQGAAPRRWPRSTRRSTAQVAKGRMTADVKQGVIEPPAGDRLAR